jgi:hypothetical protein
MQRKASGETTNLPGWHAHKYCLLVFLAITTVVNFGSDIARADPDGVCSNEGVALFCIQCLKKCFREIYL